MSLSSPTARNDYIGTGLVDTYPYTFKVFEDTDLTVIQRDTNDLETVLTLGVDFTVTGVGEDAGGDVVLSANLPLNYRLAILRIRPFTQTTDIRNQGPYYPEIHEDSFDHMVMLSQQLNDAVSRSLRIPLSVSPAGVDCELPVPKGGYCFKWNPTATGLVEWDPDSIVPIGSFSFPAGNGILVKVSALSALARTLVAESGRGIRITYGDGQGGNPEVGIDRNIVAGSGISVTNGDWAAGNPTIAAANLADSNFNTVTTPITIAASAPTPRIVGQHWFDTTLGLLRRWDGALWQVVGKAQLFQAEASISVNELVVTGTTASKVRKSPATLGIGQSVVGVAAQAIALNAWGVVVLRGQATMIADAAVALGDLLEASNATAGRVKPYTMTATGARSGIVGVALSTAAGAGSTFQAVIKGGHANIGTDIAAALAAATAPSAANPFITKSGVGAEVTRPFGGVIGDASTAFAGITAWATYATMRAVIPSDAKYVHLVLNHNGSAGIQFRVRITGLSSSNDSAAVTGTGGVNAAEFVVDGPATTGMGGPAALNTYAIELQLQKTTVGAETPHFDDDGSGTGGANRTGSKWTSGVASGTP